MPKADLFSCRCPSRDVLDMLAQKWSLLILHALVEGPMRTAELRRRIDGISEKMLIQTLRELERNGFIARQAYAEVPPRVDYRLTALGNSLSKVVRALDDWVEGNFPAIHRAQQNFDGRRP